MSTVLKVFLISILTLLCQFCLGHNGKTAYSYPLKGIKIDGKLFDWPQNIKKYKINNFLGKSYPTIAYFQTGYNLKKGVLFVAVVVQDELNEVSSESNNPFNNTEDKQIVYLDLQHGPHKGSGVIALGASQSGFKLKKVSENWDAYNRSFTQQAIDVKISHAEGNTVYEWAIHLGTSIEVYKSIGIDFLISDCDGKGKKPKHIVWSPGGAKSVIPSKLGDLVLLPDEIKTQTVAGVVGWRKNVDDNLPKFYKVMSESKEQLWTTIKVDSTGKYNFILPEGNYSLRTSQKITNAFGFERKKRIDEFASTTFKVTSEREVIVDTLKLDIYDSPKFLIPVKGILYSQKVDVAEIDNFIETYRNYCNVVGLSLVVIKNGAIIYHKQFGYENMISKKPIDGKSVFEIASVSKIVFAFAINRLAERGIIDLDKPLYQYLPFEQLSNDENAKKITARHVLSHQSGLPNWAWGGPMGWKKGGEIKLSFVPGTKYLYSGEGYQYLQRAVEKITEKDILTIIDEEVYIPFKMNESSFVASTNIRKNIVVGHVEETPMFWNLHEEPWVAGSMYSTTNDMALFMKGLMNRKALSLEGYEKIFTPQIRNSNPWKHFFGGNEQYHSLGFEIEKTDYGTIIHHGGNNGDFQSRFAMDWKNKNGFVLLTNNNNGFELDLVLQEFFFSGRLGLNEISKKNKK